MSQTERVFYILDKLRSGNSITAGGVSQRFEVSSRTIKRDIEYIRDRLDYNLVWSGRYYCLEAEDLARLRRRGEGELLFYALAMGFCRNSRLVPLVSRSVEEHLSEILPGEYQELSRHISYDLFDYPAPPTRSFSLILEAVGSRKQMHMVYSSLKGGRSERKVDPLHLKNWNGQWYLAAWCHLRKELRLFLLSRIEELTLLDTRFEPALEPEDLARRLKAGFGIMNDLNATGGDIPVTLRFTGRAARLTRGMVWHPSQSTREPEEGVREFSFPVSSYEEILSVVFSYREEAEVISPPELRDLWQEKIRKMVKNYL